MTLKLTQLEGTQNENDHVENLNSISNLFFRRNFYTRC